MPQIWRIIDSGFCSGAENMALDEALLQNFDPSSSLPLFRLYGWSPPALSLGRFQKAPEIIDLLKCHEAGISLLRRITGGGVIFHKDELTYSIVCAPHQIPPSNSIKDSYRVLTGFLLQFYRELGLNAAYAVDSKIYGEKIGERTQFCFAGKETFDILINGRKIGGNAQRRTRNVIFQHGSIPLADGVDYGIKFMREPAAGLRECAVCLSDVGIKADLDFLKSRLRKAFCDSLNAQLTDDSPLIGELELAKCLKNEKYSKDSWNIHGEIE